VSLIADDIISFSSVLKLAYDFLAGRDYLKRKKLREHKKLVSVALPFSDLAFPTGAIPVFPIRMQIFEINDYLRYLGSASNIFGWSNISSFLKSVKKLGIENASKLIDQMINEVLDAVNSKYNEMYEIGVENGIPSDFCYGIKSLYGMHVTKIKNCDATLNFTIRCSAWNKYLESLKTINQSVPQIWVDIPPRNLGNSIDLLMDNLYKAISDLEKLTGINCSDNDLRQHFELANRIKLDYKTIIYEIGTGDFYPCNPATFAEILSLLNISFQDYNSNAKRYAENLCGLVREMRERIKNGKGMDVSNMPKIFVTPMFGGWEPTSHEILYELGARTIYADWEMLKLLEPIEISKYADPVEAYARFLMNATENGIGCDNDVLTDSYIRTAKNLHADGLIFIQLFGCHSVSNCYSMLKQKIRNELEIPSIALTFNKIGENVEQVKTRLGAFMEMCH
jgi:benzoyl-CoA reductase/2-hydroxyglutaryl-CoA dehydratase subunit BcrC/BadD/HgdB